MLPTIGDRILGQAVHKTQELAAWARPTVNPAKHRLLSVCAKSRSTSASSGTRPSSSWKNELSCNILGEPSPVLCELTPLACLHVLHATTT